MKEDLREPMERQKKNSMLERNSEMCGEVRTMTEKNRKAGLFGKKAVAAGLSLLVMAALAGCGQQAGTAASAATGTGSSAHSLPAQVSSTQTVIATSGSSSVFVTPDQAEVVFGIISQGADAKSVKDQNTADYNKVIAFLEQQGFGQESIATSNLGMEPLYDWSSNTRQLMGYSMETDITVSDISLDALGSLIDNAVNNGINSIQSVSYTSSGYDEAYQEALRQAVANARGKAETLAEAGSVSLGSVINMTEYSSDTSARYARTAFAAGTGNMEQESSADMNLQPGQLEVEANVNVVFAIQ